MINDGYLSDGFSIVRWIFLDLLLYANIDVNLNSENLKTE